MRQRWHNEAAQNIENTRSHAEATFVDCSGRSRVNPLRAAMLGTLWKEVDAKGSDGTASGPAADDDPRDS